MAGWGGGTSWRTVIRAEDIGFQTMFMEIYTLRERVMDVLEAISGNRVNYGMNCLGGVMRDIADADMILSAVHAIRTAWSRTSSRSSPATGPLGHAQPGWAS
jgi:Ni,Fe-hydrogenase III large subunit